MGQYNSSLTRVQPMFDALQEKDSTGEMWLPELWRMAAETRDGAAVDQPAPFGSLLRRGDYERTIPPSTAFLKWAVQNPDRLSRLPAPDYGATGETAKKKRAALFGTDPAQRQAAIEDAIREIDRLGAKDSGQKWWAFEGFTHADACFETSACLMLIEGKRTEAVSSSTRWFGQRNQLWRNVEVAQELAAGRTFGVILGVETEAQGNDALQQAANTLNSSYPHLSDDQCHELSKHLLGFVVWSDLVERFQLDPAVLREKC